MTGKNQRSTINLTKIRADFPILSQQVHGKPLVYFDNGATTQKPKCVLETIDYFHNQINANIHRGVHKLSDESTQAYEQARETIRAFMNARSTKEIIFTSGATASINLVAFSFGEAFVSEGDEVIVSEMEHHSNIVPWQLLCERKKAKLKVLPFNNNGELVVDKLDELITNKTRIIAVTHVSNSLGTVTPIKEIIAKAHAKGVKVLVDGAQGV
ncbi:MAG TPA: aminotransferase class V-fold PLP-dependent enzyme, partial [Tenuifilaceae bacterium]|nr:aminotransferase class V-fold PLP-dependent enzyme [Tenuifilaceae bacterium]